MAYLQDTFDRADSGSWGTRSDGLASWSTIDAGSGYGWSITSNTGRITGNWNGQRGVYTSLSQHNNIKITFDFTTSAQWELSGGRAEAMYAGVKKGTTGQNGSTSYGISLWGDNSGSKGLRIIDNGTEKASVSFATTNSTLYHVEIDINSDYQMDVYVYTGAKPGSPTLSFTNGGSPYTPTASGSNFGLEYAPNESGTGTTIFDSLVIDTASTSVTVSASVLAATFSTQAPTETGTAVVSPNVLTATFSVQSATELIDEFFTPAQPLTATFSVPAVNVITPDAQILVPAPLSAVFSTPAPTVSGDAPVAIGAPLAATFSTQAPTFRGDVAPVPSVLSATFSIPTPTISAIGNVTVSSSVLAATFSLQSTTVTAEQNASVSAGVLSATFTLQTPTITAIQNVDLTATTLVATFSVQSPRRVGGLWTPQPRVNGDAAWTPQPRAI